jgi:uncharacterized alpha-E superfamily protein
MPSGVSNATLQRLVPNGFLLQTCPAACFANQTFKTKRIRCALLHQTFLNTTKRGTGAVSGLRRGSLTEKSGHDRFILGQRWCRCRITAAVLRAFASNRHGLYSPLPALTILRAPR